jgi:hypothetical protein
MFNTIEIAKAYQKRDGGIMFYINASNGVSIGIGEVVQTSKLTKGQQNAVAEMKEAFFENAIPFTGDISAHTEKMNTLAFNYTILITDCATIGGMAVENDGAYIVREGMIARIH